MVQAAGGAGMAAGQMQDMAAHGQLQDVAALERMHYLKTGRLITASLQLGYFAAENDDPALLSNLTDFGDAIGLAFQIQDDILDVTQSSERLGKTAGKDVAVQKATYPSVVGLAKSEKIAAKLTAKAFAALKPFNGQAVALEALADYLLTRDH